MVPLRYAASNNDLQIQEELTINTFAKLIVAAVSDQVMADAKITHQYEYKYEIKECSQARNKIKINTVLTKSYCPWSFVIKTLLLRLESVF